MPFTVFRRSELLGKGYGFIFGLLFWVGVNDCELSPTLVELPDEHDDGTQITKTVYGSCQEGAEVVLYTVEGGSHSWPGYTDLVEEGIEAGVGHTSADLDASAALWDFVSKFSLP